MQDLDLRRPAVGFLFLSVAKKELRGVLSSMGGGCVVIGCRGGGVVVGVAVLLLVVPVAVDDDRS